MQPLVKDHIERRLHDLSKMLESFPLDKMNTVDITVSNHYGNGREGYIKSVILDLGGGISKIRVYRQNDELWVEHLFDIHLNKSGINDSCKQFLHTFYKFVEDRLEMTIDEITDGRFGYLD